MSKLTQANDSVCFVIRSETNERENNEDCCQVLALMPNLVAQPIYLLAVADGMGGHAHGEDVSREALRKLSISLAEQLTILPSLSIQPDPLPDLPLQSAIAAAVEQANAHVCRMAKANRWGKVGATLVLALIQENHVSITSLGDSPLFHWQAATQQLRQLTTDHTIANALKQAGMISTEMAEHHSGRNMLELFVGCEDLPNPLPFAETTLAAGDRLLLCSDGISGALNLAKLEEILKQTLPLSDLADTLLKTAKVQGATDNQTLILWQHSQSGFHSTTSQLTSMPTFTNSDPWDTTASGKIQSTQFRFH